MYEKNLLGLHLAETMLSDAMSQKKRRELMELKRFVCEAATHDDPAWTRMIFRLTKQEMDYVLVDMVVQSLPVDRQAFVDLKYRRRETVTKQTDRLHVSSSQLGLWNAEIKRRVLDALQYRLTEQDIFLRTKIVNMLDVLGTLIDTKEELDPNGEVVDPYWYHSVVEHYDRYSQLLQELDDCMHRPNSRMADVVSALVAHPYEFQIVLAEKCSMNPGVFSRRMRSFKEEMRAYVC